MGSVHKFFFGILFMMAQISFINLPWLWLSYCNPNPFLFGPLVGESAKHKRVQSETTNGRGLDHRGADIRRLDSCHLTAPEFLVKGSYTFFIEKERERDIRHHTCFLVMWKFNEYSDFSSNRKTAESLNIHFFTLKYSAEIHEKQLHNKITSVPSPLKKYITSCTTVGS